MPLRANELETLFTANTAQLEKADKQVADLAKRVESKPITQKVTAETADAVAGMARVETAAGGIGAALDRAEAQGKSFSRSLVGDFLESQRAGKMSAEEIASVLTKSYNVGAAAAKELAEGSKRGFRESAAAADDVVKSMDRVEAKAKTLVSRETAMNLDIKVANAERNIDRTRQRIEQLRIEGAAGIDVKTTLPRAEAELSKMERNLAKLRTARTEIEIEAPADDALKSMDRVEDRAKRLVSQAIVTRIDAETTKATQNVEKLEADLEVLRSLEVTPRVNADIAYAERRLDTARSRLRDLEGARATMVVEADTDDAGDALDDLENKAEEAGREGGDRGGKALGAGLAAGIIGLPVIGALVNLRSKVENSLLDILFRDGQSTLAAANRLGALTGLDPEQATRMARIAGEAYTRGFGESIEANMDTSRLALQFDLIDPTATVRSSQQVVQGLSGIADVLGEDIRPTATAVATLLKTGMAANAQEAFDILAAGARNGVNRGEDLLDTFTEYPVVLKRLGLDGAQSLGLINQALDAGARNSDVAADALKEFQIRATDGSESSKKGFERLGLSASEMTAKIARGGDDARAGLQEVLDKLRETEDPVVRNAAAVELFGTKAEDLGESLLAMDLSSAVEQLDGVEGAAQRMFDRLGQSDEAKLEQAGRNLEVAVDGMKATLAVVFSEPLGAAADWISQNRGPLLQFFGDLMEGAIEFGVAGVNGVAGISDAAGKLVGGPLAGLADFFATFAELAGEDQAAADLRGMARDMRDFEASASDSADFLRGELIPALREGGEQALGYVRGAEAVGFLNDASVRLADTLGQVGITSEGTAIALDQLDASNLKGTESGKLLEEQVRNAIAALGDELTAAAEAGEGQDQLKSRYEETTGALAAQLTQMGLTEEQARSLIDEILRTPRDVSTTFGSNADTQKAGVQSLADRITTLPDGSIVIDANTQDAETAVDRFLAGVASKRVNIAMGLGGSGGITRAHGGSVIGPGTETSDSIPARLSHNEHVWTAAETRGAGGHAEVERLRRYAKAGRLGDLLPGFRTGGPVLERYIGAPPAALATPTAALAAGTPVPSFGFDVAALAAAIAAAGSGAGRPGPDVTVQLVNPVTRDLNTDAAEAAEIVRAVLG